jgi:hypothetical protein
LEEEFAMTRPRIRLRVEELESRVALSAASPTSPIAGPIPYEPLIPLVPHQQMDPAPFLQGHVQGTYTVSQRIPDVGKEHDLTGAGHVKGLHHVTVTAALHSTGFIATGHAGGTLTLTTDQGSVTLQLEGPEQPGFAPLPKTFQFTVVDATGAYQGWQASGTVQLHLHASTGTFTTHIHTDSVSLA